MKLLIVAPYAYPKIGGLENYAWSVATALHRQGHDIVIITSNHTARRRSQETIDGLRVIRLAPLLTLSNTPVNPAWYNQLKAIIKHEQPDAILAHTPVPFIADLAARAAGRLPFILTYHNDLAKSHPLLKTIIWLYWQLLGHGTLRRADRIIATSQFYAQTSPYLRPHLAKTVVVSPAVDTARFHRHLDPQPVKRQFPRKRIVLFVGSLAKSHAHKGLDLLIQAVANLLPTHPDLQLVAVGQGDNIPHYQRQAQALSVQDHITFTGFVADTDLPAYYAAAQAFVLPSTNTAEGFGMVLLEAAACGTPVIGTNVGGIPAALATIGSTNLTDPNPTALTAMLATVLAAGRASAPNQPTHSWSEAADQTIQAITVAARPKVALIHNVIAPYRLPLFQALSGTTNLEVFFTQTTTKDRDWRNTLSQYTFTSHLLRSYTIGPIAFNPGGLAALRRARFDVLITNTDPDTAPLSLAGLLLAKLRRRPIVVWSEVTTAAIQTLPSLTYAHDPFRRSLGRLISRLVMAYRGLFFQNASQILAFSQQAAKFLITHGVRSDRIRRTHQIVPSQLLPPAVTQPKRSGKSFLFVGYLSPHKNVSLLIDAFTALTDPAARLTIVGSGNQTSSLHAQAAADPRIHFTGYADPQARAELYQAHDTLVLPSLRDCWGLVVNEAIHYGLAVIVSDAAVAHEIVDHQTGLIVPVNNRVALTQAMQRLLDQPETLHHIQHHNRRLATPTDLTRAVQPFQIAIQEAAQ